MKVGQSMSVRQDAPGRLDLVRRFVNTRDVEEDTDSVTTAEGLETWLGESGLLHVGRVRHGDVDRARRVREALRAALVANHAGSSMPPVASHVLNDAAARSGLSVAFTPECGWVCEPRVAGVDGALGELLCVVVTAMADGTWSRLKACAQQSCRWAYYDTSRSRSGKWCSMAVCGNRAKQSAWRERSRAGDSL